MIDPVIDFEDEVPTPIPEPFDAQLFEFINFEKIIKVTKYVPHCLRLVVAKINEPNAVGVGAQQIMDEIKKISGLTVN